MLAVLAVGAACGLAVGLAIGRNGAAADELRRNWSRGRYGLFVDAGDFDQQTGRPHARDRTADPGA